MRRGKAVCVSPDCRGVQGSSQSCCCQGIAGGQSPGRTQRVRQGSRGACTLGQGPWTWGRRWTEEQRLSLPALRGAWCLAWAVPWELRGKSAAVPRSCSQMKMSGTRGQELPLPQGQCTERQLLSHMWPECFCYAAVLEKC